MKIKTVFFILFLTIFVVTKTNNISIEYDFEYDEISYESLYSKINESGILFPNVVFAQAIIESGHFSSEIFKCENNLFGMKQPKIRKTVSFGKSNSGYASYSSWKMSVEDYKLWQDQSLKFKNYKSENEYIQYLGRVYAEDRGYILKIKKIINNNKILNSKKKLYEQV